MKVSDAKKGITKVRSVLVRLEEIKRLIWRDNGDEVMRRAIVDALAATKMVGSRLVEIPPNGALLNPDLFTPMQFVAPSAVLGLEAASAAFPPVVAPRQGFGSRASFDNTPDHKMAAAGEREEKEELPHWCNACGCPSTECGPSAHIVNKEAFFRP